MGAEANADAGAEADAAEAGAEAKAKRRDAGGNLERLVGWGARTVLCGAGPSGLCSADESLVTHVGLRTRE